MKEYQQRLTEYLKVIFNEHEVKPEWDVAKHSEDHLTRELYSPRIDIAVGPFNITRDIWHNTANICEAYDRFMPFLNELQIVARQQIKDINFNENPRCLMAVVKRHGNSPLREPR